VAAPRRVSKWFQDTGKNTERYHQLTQELMSAQDERYQRVYDERSNYLAERRQGRLNYLRESVRTLRAYQHGFESRDGYDLRHPEVWTHAQLKKVTNAARVFNEFVAGPHQRVVPRGRVQRAALQRHTGLRGKKLYAYPVQTPSRDAKVKIVNGKITIRRLVKGGYLQDQYYYFSDYVDPSEIEDFDDLRNALKKMLPDLPDEGWYVLNNSQHGAIGQSQRKKFIDKILHEYYLAYDVRDTKGAHEGFAQSILGVIRLSDTVDPAQEYKERQSRRLRERRERARERTKLFTGRRSRRRCKQCGAWIEKGKKRCPNGHKA
jgi:hypothetical protein